jgi:hypothetical protein
MHDKIPAIRDWLKALAVLCASNLGKAELLGKLNAYAPMLAQEFGEGAFCATSLATVGRQFKFFPSYAELTEALSPWWKEHRPPLVAIASDQPGTIKQREIERQVRDSWTNISEAQVRAKIRTIRDGWMPGLYGAFLASCLRKHAPHHLALLPPEWLAERTEAADVIELRRWHDA